MRSPNERNRAGLSRRVMLGAALSAPAATLVGVPSGAASTSEALSSREPVWRDSPLGFAAVDALDQNGTTGGASGEVVVVSTQEELERYAGADDPFVIRVRGTITIEPFGTQVQVASNKTIVGVGSGAEIVAGGFFLEHVHNVIIRNLTIRDSYVAGDWDGKDNDYDGIQVDTSHHIWIDHNYFARTGDGLVDLRLDSDYLTLSWNIFSDHNKAVGQGWSDNVVTKVTMHHNWFRNVYQRNPSVDNTELAHMFNNYLENIGLYGTMIRSNGNLLVENSYFKSVFDPLVIYEPGEGESASLVHRGNVFADSTGRRDQAGEVTEPATYYSYELDSAEAVPRLVSRHAGPRGSRGQDSHPPKEISVAVDGSGDYASIGGAIGAITNSDGPTTITIKPGTYREVVQIWPNQHAVTLRGATGDAADVVITYDLGVDEDRFYGGTLGHQASPTLSAYATDVTIEDVTVENAYADPEVPSAAIAVRTVGDRTVLDRTRLLGAEGTFLVDMPGGKDASRDYLRNCVLEGDVDAAFGPATAVFDGCTVRSRGDTEVGYVTAASTPTGSTYGFLFTGCGFESAGAAETVHLGRPFVPESDAVAQVVVRDSTLDAHIAENPWADADELSWQEARFFEYQNSGPGAGAGDDRPQLSEEEAREYTVEAYLTGSDGWRPHGG